MNLLKEKGKFFEKHRLFFLLFSYLILYHILIVNHLHFWDISDLTYSTFCLDYSFGFASKILPGAIFNLIFGTHASRITANIYAIVLIVLFFIALSFIIEKFIKSMPSKFRYSALLLVIIFFSGAYTFSIFTKWIGFLDSNWLFISLFFVVALENKKMRFCLPIAFLLAILVHFSALIFYIPLYSGLMIYHAAISDEKREKKQILIVFFVSFLLSLTAFMFLLIFEPKMICSIDEFHEKLLQRGSNYFTYCDYSFFRIIYDKPMIPNETSNSSAFVRILEYIYYQLKTVYSLFVQNMSRAIGYLVAGVLILSPMVICFIRFHIRRFRAQNDKLLRFSTFLMIAQFPFIFFLAIFFSISTDITRYLTHAFLGMFIMLLNVLYHEPESGEVFFSEMITKEKSLPWKLYSLMYLFITFLPAK